MTPDGPMGDLEATVLREVEPTPDEEAAMQRDAAELAAAATARLKSNRVPGEATVQGSVAKGTWLRGSGDIDLFLLLDPALPEARLEPITEDVGRAILSDTHKRYAQHPYLMGTFRGRTVDLVPAYRVAQAGARMSAVDRTPFHTAWVRSHLDASGRGQARLLKRWLKGTGTYGAQTATGGFSGYLAEVLVARFASFRGVVAWLAADARPRRLALGPDQVEDKVSPLVVTDPVDPARNCAAAVQEETLAQAVDAARAYTAAPARRFFFPAPAQPADPRALREALQARGEAWLAIVLRPRTPRLDIVFPQFQKGARAIAAGLDQAGFPVRALRCLAAEDESEVFAQWRVDAATLPATRTHRGPNAAAGPNADRFREKWGSHPDAAGPVRTTSEGRLEVDVRVAHRSAGAWLAAHLAGIPVGRHVADSMPDARLLADPADIPAQWAGAAADFILARRPWER